MPEKTTTTTPTPVIEAGEEKMSFKSRVSYLGELRKGGYTDKQTEFQATQDMYSQDADSYDQMCQNFEYQGPGHLSREIEMLFPDNKDIRILDYGSGTGLAADAIAKRGYTNIDGLEPNKDFIERAMKKGIYKKIFTMKSGEDTSSIGSKIYDVVCSTGVFFLANSFPGYEDVEEISKMVKKGGYIIIITGNKYLQNDYVNRTPIVDAEKRGVLKAFPEKTLPGYRATVDTENIGKLDSIALMYQVL